MAKKKSSSLPKLPPEFVKSLRAVKEKRPKTVIDHILKHGFITTEELRDKYGYAHPPRAAQDVKDHGIPLEMFRVTGSDGRQIGAYRFGDPAKSRADKLAGRAAWPKNFVAEYDRLTALSKFAKKSLPDFVKESLRDVLDEESI
jgi:hypothetical protein